MKKGSPLLVLFITIFIDLLGFGLVIPILPIYSKELGATGAEVGMIAAVFSLMQLLFSPFMGSVSDRYGRRPIIMTSILVSVLGYALFANATTLLILLISRMISGIGSSNIGAAFAYISDITTKEDRAKRFGLIGAAFGLGFIFGPPIGGFLKDSFGIEAVGYGAAALCALNFIVVFFMLPESLKELNKNAKLRLNPFADLGKVLEIPALAALILLNFVFIMAFSMMHIAASLMWEEHYMLDEKQIGYVFMYIGFMSALFQATVVGFFQKKVGEQRMLLIGSICMAVGLASMVLPTVDTFIPLEFIALTFIAFGNSLMMPSINSLVSFNSPPRIQGLMMGINQSVGSAARFFGFILSGSLYGLIYYLPFISGASIMVLVFILGFRFVRKFPAEKPVKE